METTAARIRLPDRITRLRPGIKLGLQLLLCLLTGVWLTLSTVLVTTQYLVGTLQWPFGHPLAAAGSILFLFLVCACLSFLTRSLGAGALITSFFTLAFSFATYFKSNITGEPLTIADLALVRQIGHITELGGSSINLSRAGAVLLVCVGLWVVFLFFCGHFLRLPWNWSLSAAASAAALFALAFALLSNVLFYRNLGVSVKTGYSQSYVNNHCGIVLGLWRGVIFSNFSVKDYSAEAMAGVLAEAEEEAAQSDPDPGDVAATLATGKQQPNVIMILSESFFDVTQLPNVTYEEDPLVGFHALEEEGVSGTFHTRTLGYGTCNIELEMLSGINDKLLDYGENLSQWDPKKFTVLPSVPQILSDNGYYTAALHTFNDEIYHRESRFLALGFQEMFFSDDFAAIDPDAAAAADYWRYMDGKIAGTFYSDDYMSDLLIDLYQREQAEHPVFLYGITMENHTPYSADKYDHYDYTWTSTMPLTDEAQGALDAVTQGTADASAALVKLTDYFRTVDRPTIIVFFGDHHPGLGMEDGSTLYSQLGLCSASSSDWTTEQLEELYSTSYLIWSNDPDLLPGEPGSTMEESSNYLGLEVLKCTGVQLPLYWQLLDQTSQTSLMYTNAYYLDADGQVSLTLPVKNQNQYTVLSSLLFDAFRKEYVTKELWQ